MDFFDDLDATVAEDVEWGDGSDLDSNEEESRPVKQIPADTPVVLQGPAVLRQFPKPGNAASAGDGTVAISAINKDAGEVGGSSGDYTHPDVLIMLAEKAAIAHDRFYDLKWHVASAPKAKVIELLGELLETLPWLQSDEIPSLAARAGVTAGLLVRACMRA